MILSNPGEWRHVASKPRREVMELTNEVVVLNFLNREVLYYFIEFRFELGFKSKVILMLRYGCDDKTRDVLSNPLLHSLIQYGVLPISYSPLLSRLSLPLSHIE